MMRTYRLVADADPAAFLSNTKVCVDVVLRSDDLDALDALEQLVWLWLDSGIGITGSWVDHGTARAEYHLEE
jgi:hypothetical protein